MGKLDYSALKGSVPDGFKPERLTDEELVRLSRRGNHLFVRGYGGEALHLTTIEDLPHGGLSVAGLCRQEIRQRLTDGSFTKENPFLD